MNRAAVPQIDLAAFAFRAMRENGFEPEPPADVARELAVLAERAPWPASPTSPERERLLVRDLRALPWSSIDNPESRDLDQLEVAARCEGGDVRVMVAIADVDVAVPRGSALDAHAARNTTSVYTGPVVFAMLPELLSTDRTSLGQGVDRRAMVCELLVAPDGVVKCAEIYPAMVHNHAKLAYDEVAAWLEGRGAPPLALRECNALVEQLRLQDEVAQRLKAQRHARGALDLETIEARPVVAHGRVVDLQVTQKNRARELIEDLMLAANSATARFLEARGFASIRRVVKTPERWRRIVALAAGLGEALPATADALALARFLTRRKQSAPDRFADLSLSVVKLLGPGEYALERMGESAGGHFGLAVEDYAHSTAPNRRYADLVTQRLLKAAVARGAPPYTDEQLAQIASRCTERANSARKVERLLRKEVATMLLAPRVGEVFDAIVTGVKAKGTFVRLLAPPAEGRVIRGESELDVGDRLKVRLVEIDAERGYVDFERVVAASA